MNEKTEAGTATTDDMLISTLRSCGFFVRQVGLPEGQRPQMMGSIDNATAFFKLVVAGADAVGYASRAPYAYDIRDANGDGCLRLAKEVDPSRLIAVNVTPLYTAAAQAGAAPVFPPRDLAKPAEQQGIFEKFRVQRTDGNDAPGGKHYGCTYFVIDLDHDQYARAAIRAYATACRTTHPLLADDIEAKWGKSDAAPADVAPIRELIALHAEELDQNDYAYFELARTRRTDWMAWICTNLVDNDPDRKVLAKGQGSTPDEACAASVANYKERALGATHQQGGVAA